MGRPHKYSKHHYPPKSVDPNAPTMLVRDDKHMAYHLLFGNAKNIQECLIILQEEWWPDAKICKWWLIDPPGNWE